MDNQVNGAVDLSTVMPEQTSVLHVVVPGTNKRTGWQITFAGPGHPKTVEQNERLARASLDRAERIEMTQVNSRKWKGDGKQPADVRRENVEWVIGRIVEWTPIKIADFSNGEEVALPRDATPEQIKLAHALLEQPFMVPYFLQMTEFLQDQASFMSASARS
jgi:hypothetical protein